MKIFKKTIICMVVICFVFLLVGTILEFNIFPKINNYLNLHVAYFVNIFIGAFCSGLLVLVPAIVSYQHEKKEYYNNIYIIGNKLLFNSIEIINCMRDYKQDKQLIINSFEALSLNYSEIISWYSKFTYFVYFNKRDKLIESIIDQITRFFMVQEELLKLSKQMKDGVIDDKAYGKSFDIVRDEMINTYLNKFISYRNLLNKDIRNFIENRTLKSYVS